MARSGASRAAPVGIGVQPSGCSGPAQAETPTLRKRAGSLLATSCPFCQTASIVAGENASGEASGAPNRLFQSSVAAGVQYACRGPDRQRRRRGRDSGKAHAAILPGVPQMPIELANPLTIQRDIIEWVLQRQAEREAVTDAELAQGLGVDLVTVCVHLEMLFAEGRITIERGEEQDVVRVTEPQRLRHEAVPAPEAARQRLQAIGDVLDRVRETMNRIIGWAPLGLMLAGAAIGWTCSGPGSRIETTFYAGFAGLLVGCMLWKELAR